VPRILRKMRKEQEQAGLLTTPRGECTNPDGSMHGVGEVGAWLLCWRDCSARRGSCRRIGHQRRRKLRRLRDPLSHRPHQGAVCAVPMAVLMEKQSTDPKAVNQVLEKVNM